jgi:competence protein ComEC
VKTKHKSITAFVLAVFLLLLFELSKVDFQDEKDLKVYFLDVGQGDAALVVAPNNFKILIDAGRGEKVVSELEKIIPFWDKRIDLLVVSHGDLDHIGGFFDVVDRYEVGEIVRSNIEIDSDFEDELLSKVEGLQIPISKIKKEDVLIVDQKEGVYFETYWPSGETQTTNRNENSLVMELIHGDNEFLFTGDVGLQTEIELIKDFEKEIDTDVLKVGHHGSKNSTSQLFLDKTTPDISILSYGENSYGHPHQEVLDKLNNSGGEVYKTKERGTIVLRSDGEKIELFDQPSFFESFVSPIFINSFYSSR